MERRYLFDSYYSPRPGSQGMEDLFGRMNLADEVGSNSVVNFGSSPARFDNLVPMSDLGLVESSDNRMLCQNFGNVYGDCGSYQSSFYQAESERIKLINEFWRRRNNAMSSTFRSSTRPRRPYRNGVESGGGISLGRVRNRVVANGNNNVNNEVNLMDLRGRIFGLATDQNGCKMLQIKFGEIKEEEIEMILEEVVDNLCRLMIDQFGNYLVQKLIEVCSEEQMNCIVRSVTRTPYQLIRVCLDLHGTRAVQKLLESLTTKQQISAVISALSPGVVELIKDGNSHHVIQHCLKQFPDEHNRAHHVPTVQLNKFCKTPNLHLLRQIAIFVQATACDMFCIFQFLVNEIARNCYAIATDKSGCCVLQLCVDITKGQIKDHLINEIVAAALPLSEDCYGNYVVQHLLLMKIPNVTAKVLNELCGHFFSLACNKYGSNVVEKCLTETGEDYSKLVILELLRSPNVSKLLQDPFGNYVFQSALSASQGVLHNALVSLVEKNSTSMCTNLYGKKVLAWFDNKKRLCRMYANMRS